jgi:hypothetical protein
MSITDNRIVQNNLVIEISDDRIEASLTIEDRGFTPPPEYDYVIEFLKKNSISTSILEDELKKMIDNKIYNTPVIVARGKRCIPSESGKIIYPSDDPEKNIIPGPDDTIDHKSRTSIKTVSKGDAVAKVIPPVQGEDGLSVTGQIIPAGNAVEKKLPSGRNVVQDSNDKNLLIASENGSVHIISETRIDIDPVLKIPGNVDYSVGNVDFTGSIVVNGDILNGFTVKVTGSIQVAGVIENAEVYAGGDIFATGCAGGEKGSISAGGSVYIKYAENSRITAGKDITIEEYLINCSVHADGNIYATKKRGQIIGGETSAFHRIEANTIGNVEEKKTVLVAGFSSELKQQFKLIEEEQTRNLNSLGDVNSALKKMNRITMIKKQLPEEMKTQIRELLKIKNAIEENIGKVLERQIDSVKRLSQTETASVKVTGDLHPGVVINFPDNQMVNNTVRSGVMLKITEDKIILNPIRKENAVKK